MSLRTLLQAGPAKANELFARLSETSDGALKTREKLYSELKAELELHINLEEQHLFPVLRRNAETKELVTEAIKDNRELRAKLAELDGLPKNDEAFPERLKDLQKLFRQHARDEKRELLPAVQRALSEEQVQNVAGKIEADVAEAEKARHDEAEARRARARQEREEAEQQAAAERAHAAAIERARPEEAEQKRVQARQEREEAEQQAAAERARAAAIEQARQEEAEQKRAKLRQEREAAEHRAEQEAAARRAEDEAKRRAHDAAEAVVRTATAAPANAVRMVQTVVDSAQRVGTETRDVTDLYIDAAKRVVPDLQEVASLPRIATSALAEIRSGWMEWMGQTTLTGTQMSQELLRQAVQQQQRFTVAAVQGWMEHNTRVMQITMHAAQQAFASFARRSAAGFDNRRTGR